MVSKEELAQLRRIRNVVRMGHVRDIQQERITLDKGQIALTAADVVIDCTASGISRRPMTSIWADKKINLQLVRTCQPLFSALDRLRRSYLGQRSGVEEFDLYPCSVSCC